MRRKVVHVSKRTHGLYGGPEGRGAYAGGSSSAYDGAGSARPATHFASTTGAAAGAAGAAASDSPYAAGSTAGSRYAHSSSSSPSSRTSRAASLTRRGLLALAGVGGVALVAAVVVGRLASCDFDLSLSLGFGGHGSSAGSGDGSGTAGDGRRSATVAEYREPEPTPTLVEEGWSTVTFSAVGDNLVNSPVYVAADYNAGSMDDGLYDFVPMYMGVSDIVWSHDINFLDIETILGGDYLGLSGYPTFNSPSCIAEQVASFGWNWVTTATNHSLDMGVEGIFNSCATWSNYPQVTMTGTFSSWEDRDRLRTIERNGMTFGLLSYTDYLNGIPVPSGYEYSVATCDDVDLLIYEVERARALTDVVIVAMGWGSEDSFVPNDSQRFFAQVLADLGVDLVVGFGPHVIQPIEWYDEHDENGNLTGNRTLVVFSLGNFLSNQPQANENIEGCFTCTFERFGSEGRATIKDLMWTPLINHIENGGWYHEVVKLKDYTYEQAYSHDVLYSLTDPIGYAYELTNDIIGPSGVTIDA